MNPKKRKDGRYAKKVPIGADERGNKQYKTVYGTTLKELNAKIEEIKFQYSNLNSLEASQMTVKKWLDCYFQNYTPNVKEQTKRVYLGDMKHFKPLYDIRLIDLTPRQIQTCVNEMNLSSTSKNLYLTVFSTALKRAYQLGYISYNPADRVIRPKNNPKIRPALTPKQCSIFLDVLQSVKMNEHKRTVILLLYYTGLRICEALALTPEDIDLENNVIHVTKTLVRDSSNKVICQNAPKSKAGIRTVPIPDVLAERLKMHMEKYASKDKVFHKYGEYFGSGCVYGTINTKINKKIKQLYPDMDFPNITPHILRHTYSTNLVFSNVNFKTVTRLLGHSSIQITLDRYTHAIDDNADVKKTIDTLWESIGSQQF